MTFDSYCPNCDSIKIIKLPIAKNLYLCPDCKTRHYLENKQWKRDFYGEVEWQKMASYVNQTYEQLVESEYKYFFEKLLNEVQSA